MNPFYDLALQHRSIRRFEPRAVEPEKLERILGAGLRASSSGNMQAYSMIITRDEEMRRALCEAHWQQSMVLEAPVFVTFCADFRRMRKWLKLSQAPDGFDNIFSFMVAAIDAIIASQNVALAAESEGLGICYLGTTLANAGAMARVLKCPEGVVPVVGFPVGYPAENPALRDRLPLSALVHEETYRDPSESDVAEAYREREARGWDRYMSDPDLRWRVEESGVTNLAQVYSILKYTRESHIGYSKDLLTLLERQGFASLEP